jgi:hypothetical protein
MKPELYDTDFSSDDFFTHEYFRKNAWDIQSFPWCNHDLPM